MNTCSKTVKDTLILRFTVPTGLLLGIGLCIPAHAENFSRGQDLYNQHCRLCHEDGVHIRSHNLKKLEDLRARIKGWADHTGNNWNREDVDDVLYYLNKSFYHFDQKPL